MFPRTVGRGAHTGWYAGPWREEEPAGLQTPPWPLQKSQHPAIEEQCVRGPQQACGAGFRPEWHLDCDSLKITRLQQQHCGAGTRATQFEMW